MELKALAKEHGLKGCSKLRKAELVTFLQNNRQPTSALHTRPPRPTRPPPPPPALEPIDDRPIPTPQASPLVRPRQPQPPDWQNPRPYQLRPKRGKETFMEQKELPPSNLRQIKCMKKKLGKLNRKIRHSKRKHNNLISK